MEANSTLTPKQDRFCRECLVDLNATGAERTDRKFRKVVELFLKTPPKPHKPPTSDKQFGGRRPKTNKAPD